MKNGYINSRIKSKVSANTGEEYLKETIDRGSLLEMLDYMKENNLNVMSRAIKKRKVIGENGETHFSKIWTGEVEQNFNK